MITFKRMNGEYIVTHNKVQYVFREYESAWSFIVSLRKKLHKSGGKTKMNDRTRNEIMDLRDCRFRLHRKVAMLEEKALWEPENFSEEDAYWLRYHRVDIARIQATEDELRHRIAH